jgi:Fe-S-cluster containining protein
MDARPKVCRGSPFRSVQDRAKIQEEVRVKEREVAKLREEKHAMKTQLESQANNYVRTCPG